MLSGAAGRRVIEPNRWGTGPLRIRAIETVALRVPLARVFRGSKYQMDKRCTIITRVITEDGIVGEAYNGDEDEAQAAIRRIIHQELAPSLVGRDAVRCGRLLAGDAAEHLRHSARAQACDAGDGVCRQRDLGCGRQSAGHAALPAVGRLSRRAADHRHRRLLPPDQPGARRGDAAATGRLGLAGCKFKVGGATPAGRRGAFPRGARGGRGRASC